MVVTEVLQWRAAVGACKVTVGAAAVSVYTQGFVVIEDEEEDMVLINIGLGRVGKGVFILDYH